MAENDQPPAPPAETETPAPTGGAAKSPTLAIIGDGSPETVIPLVASPVERAKAKPIEWKRPEIYQTLKPHLFEANLDDHPVKHPRVHEHAAVRGFAPVAQKDAVSGEVTMHPAWQTRVLLAWWGAHGLTHESRISNEHFEAALHEALHGRI